MRYLSRELYPKFCLFIGGTPMAQVETKKLAGDQPQT